MLCPANELGGIAPLDVVRFLVAQATLPVPQLDCGVACAMRGSGRMRWVDCAVWCVRDDGAFGTACGAPTEETANANKTLSLACGKHLQSSLR